MPAAASFKRVSGGGENPTPDSGREFDNGKEAGRIEIILCERLTELKLTAGRERVWGLTTP